jgi:hypothetical protein
MVIFPLNLTTSFCYLANAAEEHLTLYTGPEGYANFYPTTQVHKKRPSIDPCQISGAEKWREEKQ